MASALNGVVRELGGVLGIAVIGTVVSSYYRSAMADRVPAGPAAVAAHDLPSAHAVAARLPPDAARGLTSAADQAFTTAMRHGALVAAAIALAGAVVVALALPRRRAAEGAPSSDPANVAAA